MSEPVAHTHQVAFLSPVGHVIGWCICGQMFHDNRGWDEPTTRTGLGLRKAWNLQKDEEGSQRSSF